MPGSTSGYGQFPSYSEKKHFGWNSAPNSLPLHNVNKKPRLRNAPSQLGYFFAETRKQLFRWWPTDSSNRPPISSAKPSLTSSSKGVSSNIVFVLLCSLWYTSSALSSNTGKSILNQFRYPVTLTFVQFGFVALYSLLLMSPAIRFTRLRQPTKAILRNTLPMGMFQVGGHIFSSIAISRIPVSTVHTVKALSPLFTVAAYAILFGVSYSAKTYISLLPLTLGVMLACSFDMSASNFIGLLCAFGSAIVFVSSNIFFKKIMPSNGAGAQSSQKLDKLNLLFYSSGMAFLLMIPIWIFYDLPVFLSASQNPDHVTHPAHGHGAPHSVPYYFFMNGTVHFAQNLIAFIILASTSPVTYSIASLIKRVAVICIAIVWFNQSIHPVQGFGILLTFTGLYMYNNAKADVERGEKKMRRVEAAKDMMLPSTRSESKLLSGTDTPPSEVDVPNGGESMSTGLGMSPVYGRPRAPSLQNHSHHQFVHNGHPPLAVRVTPPTIKLPSDGKVLSPVDSYPSPPPSLDSPPSESISFEHAHQSRLEDTRDRLAPALERIPIRV